jgi:hypothetical protein
MQSRNTIITAVIAAVVLAVILTGCFIIVLVNQPSTAQGGEQITTTITVSVEGTSDTNPHYGIVGILMPNDWSIDSVYFTGGYTDYMTFLHPDSSDAEPGGQVDFWTDSLEGRYPSGDDYMWIVYQSSQSHAVLVDTVDVTLSIKMTTGLTEGDFNLGYFVTDAALDFTDFTYYDISLDNSITISGVIPVELTSFSASVEKNAVALYWETATETNNRGFEIERSSDNSKFSSVGFINGNGTTTESTIYRFTDKDVSGGRYYYRLKQVDFDGKFEYSKTIEVNYSVPTEYSVSQNYPNPFNPSTSVEFSVPVQAKVTVTLYNSIGEVITELSNDTFNAGRHIIDFNAENLSSGTYVYTVSAEGIDGSKFVQSNKMILMK